MTTSPPPGQFDDKIERALGFRRSLGSLTFNGVNLQALSEEGNFLHPKDPASRELVLHFERAVLARRFQAALLDPATLRAIRRAMLIWYGKGWTFIVAVGESLADAGVLGEDTSASDVLGVSALDALWNAEEPSPMLVDKPVAEELRIWGLRSAKDLGGCGHIALDVIVDPKGVTLTQGFDIFAWRGRKVTELEAFAGDGAVITCQACEAVVPRSVYKPKFIEEGVIPY